MIRAQLLRLERNLSVNKVAEETGIANVTIARLERTGKGGAWDVMQKLAVFYDVQPQDLLTPVAPVEDAA